MKYDLPENLKKYEKNYKRAGIAVSVITLVVALGVLAALIVLTLDKGAAHTVLLSTFYIIVVGGVLIWSKIPKRFIDKTFCGKITDISVCSRRRSDDPARPTRETFRTYHTVVISVETPEEKTVRHEVLTLKHSEYKAEQLFNKGDEVFHLYGTDVTVVLPKETDTFVRCPVCGESNHTENETCRKCGHTLIKSIDMICKK